MFSKWQVIYEDLWSSRFTAMVRKRIPNSSTAAQETMEEVRQELALKLSQKQVNPDSVDAYLIAAFRNTLEDSRLERAQRLERHRMNPGPPGLQVGALFSKLENESERRG